MSAQAENLRKTDPVKNAVLYAEHEKQDWSFLGVLYRTLYRPFHMLYKEPMLALITVYLSFVYGISYSRESHLYCTLVAVGRSRSVQYSKLYP
jgi:MFS transporter, DHA1 family, multidrug resistance protein